MGGTDEKQNEYKSLRTRREPATAPAWALSWGIEMAKTENRNLRGILIKVATRLIWILPNFSIFEKTFLLSPAVSRHWGQ